MFMFLRAIATLGLALAAGAATAQADKPYEPRRGQQGKDVIWIATPDAAVDRMLQMAEPGPADRLVDLGSGDGKIAITAARRYGARASGLEYNPDMVELSRRRSAEAGVADRVDFTRTDIFVADFSQASVVTMYLLPELNLRLRPILFRMAPGTRVVSHSFSMGDWVPDETSGTDTATLYLWRIPAPVAGDWQLSAPGASKIPGRLQLRQRRQMVEGEARYGSLVSSAQRPVLSGDRLSFGLRDPDGAMLAVQARIEGDRLQGTATTAAGEVLRFEGRRSGPAEPIAGVAASQAEIDAAVRVLQ
ncbi:methyltransferase domain-containing protein [Xylophilus sp. Kf1]|nr:methyltransferase domain-containing protein [Xylophilus sp. Kf1]